MNAGDRRTTEPRIRISRCGGGSARRNASRAFFISAASFAALSLYGYTTHRSLSAMGSFLIMGLFGLLIAIVVNVFLRSTELDFVISAAGVLIFAGMTAWDTQRIKEMYDPIA